MVLEEWREFCQELTPDMPVLFYSSAGLEPDSYCEGIGVICSRFWDGRHGWRPCLLVELGKPI